MVSEGTYISNTQWRLHGWAYPGVTLYTLYHVILNVARTLCMEQTWKIVQGLGLE